MPLCMCTHAQTDGKLQFRLRKSHKRSKARKTSKHQWEFCHIFVVPLTSPFFAFVTLPSALACTARSDLPAPAHPAKPIFRSTARYKSSIFPTCQSLHLLPQQGCWERSAQMSHCLLLEAFAICYHAYSHASQKHW